MTTKIKATKKAPRGLKEYKVIQLERYDMPPTPDGFGQQGPRMVKLVKATHYKMSGRDADFFIGRRHVATLTETILVEENGITRDAQ